MLLSGGRWKTQLPRPSGECPLPARAKHIERGRGAAYRNIGPRQGRPLVLGRPTLTSQENVRRYLTSAGKVISPASQAS